MAGHIATIRNHVHDFFTFKDMHEKAHKLYKKDYKIVITEIPVVQCVYRGIERNLEE